MIFPYLYAIRPMISRYFRRYNLVDRTKPSVINDEKGQFACKLAFSESHFPGNAPPYPANLAISNPICPSGKTSSATPPSTQALGMP